MAHSVTSKTFAQASTPSNRIVFTFVGSGTEAVTDSEFQFTFMPNNASPTPTATRVQISPSLIEKVIVSSGTLSVVSNTSLGTYTFNAGVPYDFSESGGLPIAINPTVGTALSFTLGATTTAQVVLRGHQIAPRN